MRAIGSNPNLIILDEPTAGLDPSNQEFVWNMIEGLGSDVTRIVATHDVEKVILADRVVIMKEGSIVACGSPEKLINSHSFLRDVNKDKSNALIFIQRHLFDTR